MQQNTYHIHCIVCGRNFDHSAISMTAPLTISIGGVDRLLVSCNVSDKFPSHSGAEIERAFKIKWDNLANR